MNTIHLNKMTLVEISDFSRTPVNNLEGTPVAVEYTAECSDAASPRATGQMRGHELQMDSVGQRSFQQAASRAA